MGQITISSVGFGFTPALNQSVTISYRLSTAPDVPGSYTIVTTNATVLPNGNLSPEITIFNLTEGLSYYVKIVNNCGGTGVQTMYTIPQTTLAPTTVAQTTLPFATTGAVTTAEQILVEYDFKELNGANALFGYGVGPIGGGNTGPGFFGNASGVFFVPLGQKFSTYLNNEGVTPQPSANQYYLQVRDLTTGEILFTFSGGQPANVPGQTEGHTPSFIPVSGHTYRIEAIVNWIATTAAPTTLPVTTGIPGTTLPPTTLPPASFIWTYLNATIARAQYNITGGPTGAEMNMASGISPWSGSFTLPAGQKIRATLTDSPAHSPNPTKYTLKITDQTAGVVIYDVSGGAEIFYFDFPPAISGHTYNILFNVGWETTTVAVTTVAPTTIPPTTQAPTTVPITTQAQVNVQYSFQNLSGIPSIYEFRHGSIGMENFVTGGATNISSSFTVPPGTRLRSFLSDDSGQIGAATAFYMKVENLTLGTVLHENTQGVSNEFITAALTGGHTIKVTMIVQANTTIPETTELYCPQITGDDINYYEGAKT